MGFFSRLFGKNGDGDVEIFDFANNRLSIDISPSGININGRLITLPCSKKDFAFLGKARKTKHKIGANYTWDDAGIYIYTRGKEEIVHTFAVAVKHGDLGKTEFTPYSMYDGELTVNGSDWQREISKGTNTEVYTKITSGGYSIVAEYCDFLDSSAYANVEVSPEGN